MATWSPMKTSQTLTSVRSRRSGAGRVPDSHRMWVVLHATQQCARLSGVPLLAPSNCQLLQLVILPAHGRLGLSPLPQSSTSLQRCPLP